MELVSGAVIPETYSLSWLLSKATPPPRDGLAMQRIRRRLVTSCAVPPRWYQDQHLVTHAQ